MKKEKIGGVICGVLALLALMNGYAAIGGEKSKASYLTWPSEVRSIADDGADLGDKTYVITSAMQNMSDDDLEFKRVAKWINNALGLKGYTQVDSKEKACLIIRLAFGQGEPQTSTSTYTTGLGYSYPVGYYRYYVPPRTETVTSTVFSANLILEAYDLKTPGKLPQMWKTTLTAAGTVQVRAPRDDERISYLPMIAASIDYFGTNTEYKRVYISNDPAGQALMDSLKK